MKRSWLDKWEHEPGISGVVGLFGSLMAASGLCVVLIAAGVMFYVALAWIVLGLIDATSGRFAALIGGALVLAWIWWTYVAPRKSSST